MTKVRLLQLAVDEREPVDARIDRVISRADSAMTDVDLVVLPELWPTGAFDLARGIEHAQQVDGDIMTRLAAAAKEHHTWVHAGSIVERDGSDYYNTSVVIDDVGRVAATYRKLHLFGFDSGEAALMTPGDEVVVVETPLGPTGLATCYDLRFPELFRKLVDEGATSIIVSSGWPLSRVNTWELMIPTRAAENQCFVIGCNATGFHAGVQLAGRSLIADPMGNVIARGSDDEETLTKDIDVDIALRFRQEFPVLLDRRFVDGSTGR